MKPKYVIKIKIKEQGSIHPESGYYSASQAWQFSSIENATKLTHKEALPICGYLKRLGYVPTLELYS